MNYSYIIQPKFCEGTLRKFDQIKNYFIFSPLYAKTNHPILVPIEYLQCVEGGATKFAYGHIFNLLYRDWIVDKLNNREPSKEEQQIFKHLLALQPHCNVDLCPCCLSRTISRISRSGRLSTGFPVRVSNVCHSPTTHFGLTVPQTQRPTVLTKPYLSSYIFHSLSYSIHFVFFFNSIF